MTCSGQFAAATALVATVWLVACATDRPARAPAPPPPAVSDAAPPDAAPPDAAPPIAEAYARLLLDARFRAAGLRILADRRVTGDGYDVTLDGWDPARRIGFEYVAPEEVGTDLDETERAALAADSTLHVLVVDGTSAARLTAAADAFLAGVQP